MAYRLRHKESTADGVRRIAREEAEKGIRSAERGGADGEERVHDARTRCKKLRGLLRLVRPQLDETYRVENKRLRDLGRSLSGARDAGIVRKTFEDLARRGRLDREVAEAFRGALASGPEGQVAGEGSLARFAAEMRRFYDGIESWPLERRGFSAFAVGLADIYRDGRRAMRRAAASGGDEDLHEWRKQAKYHWYHVRLLRGVWRPVMEARHRELERLSDLLGDDHDLTLVRAAALADGGPSDVEPLTALIDDRQRVLRTEAFRLGGRIYAEGTKPFTQRVRRYWRAWRKT